MEQMSIEMQKLVEDQETKFAMYETDIGNLHEENSKLQTSLAEQMQANASLVEEMERLEHLVHTLNDRTDSIKPSRMSNTTGYYDGKDQQRQRNDLKKKVKDQPPPIVHRRTKTKYLPVRLANVAGQTTCLY